MHGFLLGILFFPVDSGFAFGNQGSEPWHFLYFFPLPQGHGSLRPIFADAIRGRLPCIASVRSMLARCWSWYIWRAICCGIGTLISGTLFSRVTLCEKSLSASKTRGSSTSATRM